MKETFKDLFIDMLRGDLSDIVICIMLWVLTIFAVGGIGYLLFTAIDKSTGNYKIYNAVVVGKFRVEPGSLTTYVKVGNMLVPTASHYGGRLYISVSVAGENHSVVAAEVYEPEYNKLETGDSIVIYALKGGITKRIVDAIYFERK